MSSLPIASVSAQTGIAKEVLRKWEKRYGFPTPNRDANGNRLYATEQIKRLQLISQLIDDGMRPGVVVPLSMTALHTLLADKQIRSCPSPHITHAQLVGWLQLQDPEQLRHLLHTEMLRTGLAAFVVETLPAMSQIVGLAWQRGEISLHSEHVYSEIMQDLLRVAFARINRPDGYPRVLLTTPVGELHTFGILMLQVFLSLKGAYCISLGAQTPPEEIALAARQFRIDITCLSISACFAQRKVVGLLKQLRRLLPPQTTFWAGGAGVADVKACPRGVKLLMEFDSVASELNKFLKQHQALQSTGLIHLGDQSIDTESGEPEPIPAG